MKTPLLIIILLLTIQIFLQADVRYVSKTGSSEPPYLTWETAADSIQKAINVCNIGDTIIVDNGTYYESIYVSKTLNIWGSSVDSTIINGIGTPNNYILYFYKNSSVIKNFKLISPGYDKIGINIWYSNVVVSNCIISNIKLPLNIFNSSPKIENNIILNLSYWGIHEECPNDTCNGIYRGNIILSTGGTQTPVDFSWGYPTFTNNILIEEGNIWRAVQGTELRGIKFQNNLIAGYKTDGIVTGNLHLDTAYIINNTFAFNSADTMFGYGSIATANGKRTQIKNNIIANSPRGINGYTPYDATRADYNLFWNVRYLTEGNAVLIDSNIVADPMFVKDTIPTSTMTYDLHLQKYSPAIDKGDPTILDKDGSRSDLGMFGGPGGEEYTYKDLIPRAPVNFTAVVTSDSIKLKWNRNSEADTAYYLVYRDTVESFLLDTTKIVAAVTDTFYNERIPLNARHLYYKITAVDKNNNQSFPSEEIYVNLTPVITEEPYLITSYNLYQNYPNPFNPTTKIGYRLKERGYVKLMIYDIKGELIKVLVNKEQESGYYEIEFIGKDLASQILLYRIEVLSEKNIPVFSYMKKMIILK